MIVEIVRKADISDVATSHDIALRKWVLAAAGKYPEGRMVAFSRISLTPGEIHMIKTSPEELKIFVQSEGESVIPEKGTEIPVFRHDLVTIPPETSISARSGTSSPSVFYLLNWAIT
jgi:hypothetical protein